MTVLRLKLLGGFAFERLGSPIQLPAGMQRLLAYLALHGTSHRCVVAGTLWPEAPETQAMASLRTSVWRMNRAFPGVLSPANATLSLSGDTSVDSREQERFATQVLRDDSDSQDWCTSQLECLWSGDLLPGWYEDWVTFERERLSQLRLHALERSARVLIQRQQLDIALQLALEAVRAEPLRESATALLMAVYLAEGNVVDAIRQYDVFRMMLHSELDVEPSFRLTGMLPPRFRR